MTNSSLESLNLSYLDEYKNFSSLTWGKKILCYKEMF